VADDAILAAVTPGRSQSVARERIADAANTALAPVRVRVRAWGGRFIVAGATGRSVLVDRVSDIAAAAAALAGR
jgi:hypothetical protein